MIKEDDLPKMPDRISKDLKNLISVMLVKDFSCRPSIDQVLGSKIILE